MKIRQRADWAIKLLLTAFLFWACIVVNVARGGRVAYADSPRQIISTEMGTQMPSKNVIILCLFKVVESPFRIVAIQVKSFRLVNYPVKAKFGFPRIICCGIESPSAVIVPDGSIVPYRFSVQHFLDVFHSDLAVFWQTQIARLDVEVQRRGSASVVENEHKSETLVLQNVSSETFHGNPWSAVNLHSPYLGDVLAMGDASINTGSNTRARSSDKRSNLNNFLPPWRLLMAALVGIFAISWGWCELRSERRENLATVVFFVGLCLWGFAFYGLLWWSFSL